MRERMLQLLQILGIILVILGVLLFVTPYLLRIVPSLEEVLWIILYVYRNDGFVFVTSPLLIIISVISILWSLLFRPKN